MFKKLGIPALLIVGLAGCGENPISVQGQQSATTLQTTTTPTLVTRTVPETTTTLATVAPTEPVTTTVATTDATTAPPTVPPTTPAPPPPAQVGDLEVLTATGVGNPLSDSGTVQAIDSLGFTADSAGNYVYFGGPQTYPFVNLEGGRLVSIRTNKGDYETSEYSYAFDLPAGQTAEATANAAAAPLTAKYPDYSTSTITSEDDGRQTYSIELEAPRGGGGDWTVSASTSAEVPTLGFVTYEYADFGGETGVTGPALIPPAFLPAVEAQLTEASLPSANISSYSVTNGIGMFGPSGLVVTFEIELPDQDYATVTQTLTGLTNSGWTLEDYSDPEESMYYTRDNDEISVRNSDEFEGVPTKVSIDLDLEDDPVSRPSGG